jgi:hypothetical protein
LYWLVEALLEAVDDAVLLLLCDASLELPA